MIKIPLKKTPSQSLKIRLDKQNCEIKIYYRFGDTYCDLTVNGEPVVAGAICRDRTGIVQIAQTVFSGQLLFVDMLGSDDPIYTGFGSRFRFFYKAADES